MSNEKAVDEFPVTCHSRAMNRNERLRHLMLAAWETAREGARRYGGKAREYIAVALRMAWKALRKATWFAGEDRKWHRPMLSVPVARWTHSLMAFVVSAIGTFVMLADMTTLRTDAGSKRMPWIASFSTLKRNWRSGLSRSRLGFRPSG